VHGEVEEPVHAEQRQHVIEKRYSGLHVGTTASVQIDGAVTVVSFVCVQLGAGSS
jgi:hypothetical protein